MKLRKNYTMGWLDRRRVGRIDEDDWFIDYIEQMKVNYGKQPILNNILRHVRKRKDKLEGDDDKRRLGGLHW